MVENKNMSKHVNKEVVKDGVKRGKRSFQHDILRHQHDAPPDDDATIINMSTIQIKKLVTHDRR